MAGRRRQHTRADNTEVLVSVTLPTAAELATSELNTLAGLLAEQFSGMPFETSFRDRVAKYTSVVATFFADTLRVSLSDRLSQMGKLEEWAVIEKSGSRQIQELLAADVSGIDAHI